MRYNSFRGSFHRIPFHFKHDDQLAGQLAPRVKLNHADLILGIKVLVRIAKLITTF